MSEPTSGRVLPSQEVIEVAMTDAMKGRVPSLCGNRHPDRRWTCQHPEGHDGPHWSNECGSGFDTWEAVKSGRVQAPRCEACCVHGVPWNAGPCLWCEDEQDGYYDAHPDDADQQWLCPHGVGVEPGQDNTWPPRSENAPARVPSSE